MITELHHSTTDADEARALIEGTFPGSGLRISGPRDADWTARLDVADAGPFAASRMRLPGEVHFDVGYDGFVFVTTVLDGRARVERGRAESSYAAGDVLLGGSAAAADIVWRVRTESLELAVLTLPEAALREALGAPPESGYRWDPGVLAPTPEGSRRWRRLTSYVDTLLADPQAAESPLLLGSVARMLAATVATLFPTEPPAPAAVGHDSHPETLRRAIAFVESYPHLDIGLDDIAQAARVTPRAVQLAFRRHVGVTPLAFLRRVRLDRVRADLLAADPATTTVTAVAARWGFASSSRFAAHYRAEHGEPPSATLRR